MLRMKGIKPGLLRHLQAVQEQSSALKVAAAHSPKKSYGQHFLQDRAICSSIVDQAKLQAADCVLEIGPGTGQLTAELLKTGAHVIAVEADESLLPCLDERFYHEIASGQLSLLSGDATCVDLNKTLMSRSQTISCRKKAKVVANLPFSITTNLLKILLPMAELISEVTVMLQLEAAQRLTGRSQGDSEKRAMNIMVDFYSTASLGMSISRTSFYPPPHVDCALAKFVLKSAEDRLAVPSEGGFCEFIEMCFRSRRKTLKNSLRSSYATSFVLRALEDLGLAENSRPQELTVESFAALCQRLDKR